ncbi:MAG TPA: hypothetical protein VGC65_05535 [Bacteroidia bacterium]|jgi:hypothetical protein
MRKFLFLVGILVPLLFSCQQPIKKLGENPAVSYFIIGRLKTFEITEGTPFNVKVFRPAPSLIETPFRIKILSIEQFELSYQFQDKEIRKSHFFGKEIDEENMHLIISANAILKNESLKSLKYIDYAFEIKGENQP